MLKLESPLMSKKWLLTLIVLAITAVPVMAANNNPNTANDSAANASAAASPSPDPNPSPTPNPSPSLGSATSTASDSNVSALLGVLVKKGVLAPTEANAIRNALPSAQFQALVDVLSRKGVLNAADLSVAAPASSVVAAPVAATEIYSSSVASPEPAQGQKEPGPMRNPPPIAAPAVIPAIAPVRVVTQDPPKKDGLNAAFKMGPVKMTPYGFIKTTLEHDSSSPDGDDFPFIGLFLNSTSILNTGPTADPEFHIKARSTRIGANLEWPDPSPKLTITGRIEADFEGMFSTVNNRDITSIRNPSFQMRLAYVRMDYAASPDTDIYFQGGQDWSIYGSTALANLYETTFFGAYYGNSYTRSPQFQVGAVQKLTGSVKLLPTFAIMMPSTGQIEKLCALASQGGTGNGTCLDGYENQLGQGEREGADADRPEYEGRLALQFQADKAPGVAPAQIFWSGFHSRRTSIVPNSNYLCDGGSAATNLSCSLEAAFPNGFQTSSKQYGNQLAIQLPTRWFTLVASGYKGGDLRFFTAGQVSAYVDDVTGLSGVTAYVPSDGVTFASGASALACNVALNAAGVCPSTGNVVVAPERPVRAFGGFIELGLPLSRWFNANPKGHNAGWQLYLHAGKDQGVNRDLTNPNFQGALPLLMGKMAVATLFYKVNPWCTFGFEQSVYATRLISHLNLYDIAGVAGNEWQDHRSEFGPTFTF